MPFFKNRKKKEIGKFKYYSIAMYVYINILYPAMIANEHEHCWYNKTKVVSYTYVYL